jgi:phosphatidylglycerol lysyltransferase
MSTKVPTGQAFDPEAGGQVNGHPWLKPLTVLAILMVVALALLALRRQLGEVNYQEIVDGIEAQPPLHLVLAVVATFCSFLFLSAFDFLSLAYLESRIAALQVFTTSFIAFAIGNFLGFGLLTGGAIRARAYSTAGLDSRVITQLISMNGIAYFATIILFGSVAMLLNIGEVTQVVQISPRLLQLVTAGFLLVDVTLALTFIPRVSHWLEARWQIRVPRFRQGLGYLAAGAFDMGLSAAVFWLLLPADSIAFGPFAAIFTFATALGLVSQIPGGVGVFEAVILTSLGNTVDAAGVASALVLYRLIYYGLPLLTATGLVVWHEFLGNLLKPLHRIFLGLAPHMLALVAVLVGMMLLFSRAVPSYTVEEYIFGVPLFLTEAAHLFGSVSGLALLLVARGLQHRLNSAWLVAFVSALVGVVLALPNGVAWLELGASLLLCIYLYLARSLFTRHSLLINASLTSGWWLYILAVLGGCLWLVFFAYQDVQYSHELWWQFELDGHAPRSLRALMTVMLLTFAVGLSQLIREPDVAEHQPDATDTAMAMAIAVEQNNPNALLVAMGDKLLQFSANANSFVMYRKLGRSWIALFDPIGAELESGDQIWNFIDKVERHGGRVAFYEVRPENLPLYLDAGLRAWKVGECAVVDLRDFDLETPQRSKLRQALKRGERDGLTFSIVEKNALPDIYSALEQVSTSWLEHHNTREKAFSLGAFSRDYVAAQPVAVVRFQGEVVAFATLQVTNRKVEVSIDLMRHLASAPKSCMDFLFCHLLLHFKQQGYQRFSLGMAPMSGMPQHRLANRWHKLAQFIYTYGERFYNFQGLRSFKQKFGPEWEPRYLVTSPGYMPIMALKDIAVLVSGSLKGVVTK